MSNYTGRSIKIGIGKEASRGQGATAEYWIPHKTVDIDYKTAVIVDDQSHGVIEGTFDTKVVTKWAEGSIGGIAQDQSLGLLLLAALGNESSTSSPEAGVYTHVFNVAQNHQHPSLCISYEDGVEDRLYPRAMINSLEIVAELNQYIMFNANFMADTGSPQAVTPAYTTQNYFTAEEMKVYYAETQANLATATETKVTSAKVTIEKDVELENALGQASPNDILNKTIKVSGEFTRYHTDDTFKDRFNAGSPFALRLEITSGTTIGAASNPKLTIDLNKVNITDGWAPSKDLDGFAIETVPFTAHYKIADAKMIQATLVNQAAQFGY